LPHAAFAGGSRWRALPALFWLPCQLDARAAGRKPVVTWALAAAIALVSLMGLVVGVSLTAAGAGLIPDELARNGGMTLLTSFFVHGGIAHALMNLYLLLAFGADVEERVGSGRFALLVLASALAGSLGHVVLDPRGNVPLIGASGGVSGVLAYYALSSPDARLGCLIPDGWLRLRWLTLRASTAFGIWIALLGLGACVQLAGASPDSSAAHLAGATAGALLWLAHGGTAKSEPDRCPVSSLLGEPDL
jgi:membrane associated rhomboid family serine protease